MNHSTKYSIAIALAVALVAHHDLFARGFGGGGRGGGGPSMSRGGFSGGSVSRGGFSGGSASRGGFPGGSASRSSAGARTGSISASGRTIAGQKGIQSYTGPRGGSVTLGGAKGGVSGPLGSAAGRVGGIKVEGAGGRTATKVGAGGAAKGPGGAVAGQARGGSVSGSRGSISGGQARSAGRNFSTDAGFAKYRGGVSVRGASGATVHRTRSVTAVARQGQSVAVRRNVNTRYAGRANWYSAGWYAKYPDAWCAARWTTAAVRTAATWRALTGWWGYPATYVSAPVYYDYGNTIVYEGDTVYNGGEEIATADVYYEQANKIAEAGDVAASEDEEWKSLGVWAMVQGDQTESNNILQMAVNKEGVIRGNHYNVLTDTTDSIQGSVDKKTQRAAWTIGDNDKVVSETGIYNLTKDETEMLIHYGADKTEQWTLVRLQEPNETAG